ncbi:hypothetical protein [Azoarcus sp. DN11]|uniref:hypothetical protein n=1 Tax=Azoarcus sp. DN11 TaxID=356837 RepID=UPI000EB2F461|nr:hypothetical protein [Azoarcus sp. DN11]AYH45783.1 hypothetical protein CDA09_20765 [Azoarcus sp. DN11]
MIDHKLFALRESSPFHALVAMGTLRVAVEELGMQGATLHWQGGHATVRAPGNLLEELARYAPERGSMSEYTAVGSTRGIEPAQYVALAQQMPNWMAGLATITVLTRDGTASATRWDMTGGRQQLLKDVGTLLTRRLPRKIAWSDRLLGALIDGSSAEEGSAFGLDPEGFRSHALSAFAPSQSNMAQSTPLQIASSSESSTRHPARVWLAVEAFPLHPVTRSPNGRAQTPGWQGDEYHWLAWDRPLPLDAVRGLIAAVSYPSLDWPLRGFREYAAPRVALGKYGAMRAGRRAART